LAQRRGKRVERKAYSGKLDRAPSTIAVLGGGLTGLTTAYYLTRALPRAKITIFEADARLGGWIDTEKASVKTPDGNTADVYFERAARMIKPQVSARSVPKWDDAVFFDLVCVLRS
jgi:oxygen-dependent protoporphyrinogen oxidase